MLNDSPCYHEQRGHAVVLLNSQTVRAFASLENPSPKVWAIGCMLQSSVNTIFAIVPMFELFPPDKSVLKKNSSTR